MALNFVNVTRKDQGRGLDSFSAKSSIPAGYAEDLRNVDTNANGKLETRKGYEGYYGWVPFRVARVEHSGTTMRLQFATSQAIDLTTAHLGPLVVYGLLSAASGGSGDFSTTTPGAQYYPTFTIASKVTLTAGSHTISYTAAQHGFGTANLWVGLAQLTSTDASNVLVMHDNLEIDPTTYAVSLDYTLASGTAEAQVYFKDVSADPGNVYVADASVGTGTFTVNTGTDVFAGATPATHTLLDGEQIEFTTTGTLPAGLTAATRYFVRDQTATTFKVAATEGGTAIDVTTAGTGTHTWHRRTFRVPAATHQLNNFKVLVEAHDTSGTTDVVVAPHGWSVNLAGQVEVEFTSDFSGSLYLVSAPNDQSATTTATTGTQTFTITNPGSSLLFLNAYRFNSSTNRYESVLVHDYAYDQPTDTLTITYTLAAVGTESVDFYWVSGQTVANSIEIAAGTAATYVDELPQLTVWGLDHEGTYRDSATPGGHVTHLDTYRRAAEARLVCGLGGNLFKASTHAEAADTYLLGGPLYTNLRDRLDAASTIRLAPLFWTSNPGTVRTRGVVYDTNVSADNYARVTAATYVSSGVVDYTLSWASKTGSIALAGVLSANDYLTVRNLSRPEHTGSWQIQSVVSDSATQTVLRVANAAVTNATFDVSGAHGEAGVFTDTFDVEGNSLWLPGDRFVVPNITEDLSLVLTSFDGTTAYISGVESPLVLSDGTLVFTSRTSSLVPLRNFANTPSVVNLVRGDMLVTTVAGETLARRVRVRAVRAGSTQAIDLEFLDDDVVEATVSGPDHGLNAGDRVVLRDHVDLVGEHTVSTVVSPRTFQIVATTPAGAASSATLQGEVVELDEAIELSDGDGANTFYVDGRWTPIEAPTAGGDLAATTTYRYLDYQSYEEQLPLRSTTLNDAMYFVNGVDEVWKFDGWHLYRAGLPRWQLGLFTQVDTTSTAVISTGQTTTYSARDVASHSFEVDSFTDLVEGDRVVQGTLGPFLVTKVTPTADGTKTQVFVRPEDNISGVASPTGTLTKVVTYEYYARLNMIDSNGYTVASAAVSSQDLVVDYTSSGAVRVRLLAPPAFGPLDYDRVEFELYRRNASVSAVSGLFYLHTRQLVPFDAASPYIDVVDSLEDSVLTRLENTDAVTTALVPAPELGTGWDQPPRASHLTSLNGRLLLGNVRGWPEAQLVFKPTAGASTLTSGALAGKVFTFRRDGATAGTTTDMTDTVRYEFVTYAQTFTFVDGDVSVAADTVTETAHGLVTGQAVVLTNSGGALPAGLTAGTTYYVIRVDANTFKFATSPTNAAAGTAVNISAAAGGGTHTLTATSGLGLDAAGYTVTTTTFSFALPTGHGLAAGDWVYLFHSAATTGKRLRFAGWWQIASVTATNVTINYVSDGAAATTADCDRFVTATDPSDVPVWIGNSGLDGNYTQRDGNSTGDSEELTAPLRLANAVNASMRATTTADFVPWLSAYAGNDYPSGQVLVRCPQAQTAAPALVTPSVSSFQLFVNDELKTTAESVGFLTPVFPSRLLRSYTNYPEVFDNPFADATTSDSVIDVNPADGQEITGVIPFFTASATGTASAQESVAVVFKTNSVYLVNTETRAVQRLDTRGLGCTAPRSVAPTQGGIAFANHAGVFRLGQDNLVTQIGLNLTGLWRDSVNRDRLAEAHGHHYAFGRRYKLSVPTGDGLFADQVYVYDYDREGSDQAYGAWTRYEDHAAVGWCNLDSNGYWASQSGDVFLVRGRGEAADYRDEDQSIGAQITLRAEDFDLPGTRKAVAGVDTVVELELTDLTGLQVEVAQNLSSTFQVADAGITVSRDAYQQRTIRSTPPTRRGNYVQVRYTHEALDEALVLVGTAFDVAQLAPGKLLPEGSDS